MEGPGAEVLRRGCTWEDVVRGKYRAKPDPEEDFGFCCEVLEVLVVGEGERRCWRGVDGLLWNPPIAALITLPAAITELNDV